jgi:hypothetical protein
MEINTKIDLAGRISSLFCFFISVAVMVGFVDKHLSADGVNYFVRF